MRSESTIKKMENRVGQDNIDAFLNESDFWRGFETALMWVQNKTDIEDSLHEYEREIWNHKEGYEKDPKTGEYVSVVELHPDAFDSFGEREYEVYIGEDWRERLEARGFDWRAHLKELDENSKKENKEE